MNNRERLLSIIVGGLLAVLVGVWGYSQVRYSFSKRAGIRRQLEGQLTQKKKIVASARNTSRQLAKYEQMSLSSNVEISKSQYQAWLSELLTSVELDDPQVKVASQSKLTDGSTLLTCTASGKGDLRQLTQLLYQFYSVNTIHRIRVLPVAPIRDSKLLDINMTIDVYILGKAELVRDFDTSASSDLAQLDPRKVIDPIVERNMFAPANHPPKLPQLVEKKIQKDQPLAVSVAATDEDDLDRLAYSLQNSPEGARMDATSGSIVWQPKEVGEYEFRIRVEDDGIPRRYDEQTFRVTVTEPAEKTEGAENEELAFDDAKFTYAIATVEADKGPQLWLMVRTRGTILRLKVGEKFKVGSVDAVITKIEDRGFEWDRAGTKRIVRLGEPLVAADATP